MSEITPSRSEALTRLRDFVPHAGKSYAARRNFDLPGHPHVSCLSPYIRHRMIGEDEVLRAVLGRHSLSAASKFVQEVFWRTYWKGWLELRPAVWVDYRHGVQAALNRVQSEAGLGRTWESACRGKTGIPGFDDWARELAATGYLHNHARMWFASIWIFTLRLPWELGADFFLRHLLDGDAASNTLSWRWVAGLQTRGKTYTARALNIAKFTEGRHGNVTGLNPSPQALDGPPPPKPRPLPEDDILDPSLSTGLVVTEDDLSPSWLLSRGISPVATSVMLTHDARSPLQVSGLVCRFANGAAQDCFARHGKSFGEHGDVHAGEVAVDTLTEWAERKGLAQLVTPYAPVGPAADRMAELSRSLESRGIALVRVMRSFDRTAWPHATAGFFRFKETIPDLLEHLDLAGG